jgi:hypothetical protein
MFITSDLTNEFCSHRLCGNLESLYLFISTITNLLTSYFMGL